jgi:hypothetical protein
MSTIFNTDEQQRIAAAGITLAAAEAFHQSRIERFEESDHALYYNDARDGAEQAIASILKHLGSPAAFIWGGDLNELDLEGAGSCYLSTAAIFLNVRDTEEAAGDLLLSLKVSAAGALKWPSELVISDREVYGMGDSTRAVYRDTVGDDRTDEQRIAEAFRAEGHPAPEEAAREAAIYIEAVAEALAEAQGEIEAEAERAWDTWETVREIADMTAEEIADRNRLAELSRVYN